MTVPPNNAAFYADFKTLSALKHEAKTDSQKALRGAAQQFESLFINEMLKSMRQATSSVGDSITGGNEMDMYQGMYDQQIATQLSKSKGFGLADLLVQQLNRSGMVKSNAVTSSSVDKAGQGNDATKSIDNENKDNTGIKLHPGKAISLDKRSRIQAPVKSTVPIKSTAMRFTSPADFVEKMWPHAQLAAQKLGVDPTTLIAHAALETGWGKHVPRHGDGSSSHNLFGIKASHQWNGNSIDANTLEFSQGVTSKRVERFKAYDSPAECFADYASLLASHPRYGATLNTGMNTAKFANALQHSGYATDPKYAHKLEAVAHNVMSLVAAINGNSTTQYAHVSQAHSSHADT